MPDFIAEIDERELALRLCERATGMRRPAGASVAEAYAQAESVEGFATFKDLARVAMLFFQEQITNLRRVS